MPEFEATAGLGGVSGDDEPEPTPPKGLALGGVLDWSDFDVKSSGGVVDLEKRLELLPGWELADGDRSLVRTFVFGERDKRILFVSWLVDFLHDASWTVALRIGAEGIELRLRASNHQKPGEDELSAAMQIHSAASRLGAGELPSGGDDAAEESGWN